jgi:hypothetical protein
MLTMAASGGLCACLMFDCPPCADGGTDAGTCTIANLWSTHFEPEGGTSCQSLSSELNALGGEGTATCGFTSGHVTTTWGVATILASPDAGALLCSRVNMTALPTGTPGIRMDIHCTGCEVDSGSCGCAYQLGAPHFCEQGAWSDAGIATTGPFQVPASCPSISVSFSLNSPDSGSVQFDDAWVWTTTQTVGCVWNTLLGCPEE